MMMILIEHDRGEIAEESLQLAAFARRTAEAAGLGLAAVLIGAEARPLAETLKPYGVDKVILAAHEGLTDYAPEAWAAALAGIIEAQSPQAVMAPSTDRGNEVMAHVGARTGLPVAANCSEVHPGQPYAVVRQRWGGSLLEDADLIGPVALVTVASDLAAPEEASSPGEAAVEEFRPELSDRDLAVRVVAREETVEEGVNLKTARLVIGGGRGMGGPDGYSVLEELAELTGAAVGGSRVATNNGWRPHTDQIGLTGSRIAPELYIACGISGAIQHLVGCKGAKNILVINNDPEAAFFAKADYGIVGDLFEVIPAITEEIRKAKS